jgi:hypothetical protein
MDSEYLVLPYPMSANRYWVKANNRIIVSNEGRAYKMAIMARVEMVYFSLPWSYVHSN